MRWILGNKATRSANRLADRHYSTRKRRARKPATQVGAPGRLLVLVTDDGKAFWISRQQDEAACLHAWPGAWECSAFRNEGPHKASELVEEAVAATLHAWGPLPPEGFITFVDPIEVREKRDPGHCFVIAGFRLVGSTRGGHGRNPGLVFKLKPSRAPKPEPAIGSQAAFA